MNLNKKIFFILTISVLILASAGCKERLKKNNGSLKTETAAKKDGNFDRKKFVSTPQQSQTAIDSAIELAKKCEVYSSEILDLRKQNSLLADENTKLKEKLKILEPELKQTKKELNEANDLLVEMRLELNNWKMNILGYRDEMRNANKAQLQALLKILTILGGEVNMPEDANQN